MPLGDFLNRLTGLIYKEMESYEAAIDAYREAIRRAGNSPDGVVEQAIAMDSNDLNALLLKATIHVEQAQFIEDDSARPVSFESSYRMLKA